MKKWQNSVHVFVECPLMLCTLRDNFYLQEVARKKAEKKLSMVLLVKHKVDITVLQYNTAQISQYVKTSLS